MSVQAISWAMAQKIERAGPKLLLICVANYANRSGYCWPSHETLVHNTSLKDRSVREHMRWLEREGYLRRERRYDGNGNRLSDGFQLTLEPVANSATSDGPDEAPGDEAPVANIASSAGVNLAGASGKNQCEPVADSATGKEDALYNSIEPLNEPSVARGCASAREDTGAGGEAEAEAGDDLAASTADPETAMERLLGAMGIDEAERPYWRKQADTLAAWQEQHDLDEVILPAVRLVISRFGGTGRGRRGTARLPENIRRLGYFDNAVNEVAEVRKAGGRLPGEPAQMLTAAKMRADQWRQICRRYARGLADCARRNVEPAQMASWQTWPETICPPPGKAGCLCPEEILAEFGLGKSEPESGVGVMTDEDWEAFV